jgi:DNA-binding winged helix-turn-helix (wHTH) protein
LILRSDGFDFALAKRLQYRETRTFSSGPGAPKLLYLFEDFALDCARRELRRGDELLSVEPQVFDLLQYLIRNRDRVVSKDDLINSVWKGRIISDATVSSRINAARSALHDNGVEQRLIRTVLRKGVRFVGAVREEGGPGAEGLQTAMLARPSIDRFAAVRQHERRS